MPHDNALEHWHEIAGNETKAGKGTFERPKQAYDKYMEEQGLECFRDIGISKVQNLELKPWNRLGGKGRFIQLYGTEGMWGCYVLEVAGAGATTSEKHLYEEQFFVIEGRGTTEVWLDGQEDKKHVFEWQEGSLFSIPVNAMHRLINAGSAPALLLAGTTAPNIMNLYDNPKFIFECPFNFTDRFSSAADFFKPSDDISPDPIRGLAMRKTNLLPDIVNCELPVDNRRSPGFRRIEPNMTGNHFYMWIGQHETGRYSKAHAHTSAAVLICLKGKGYTYTWPSAAGPTPWKDGKADQVKRVDYEPVGMISAAPMAGDWFHQHFGGGAEPLRLTAWYGPFRPGVNMEKGVPGEKVLDYGAIDIREGGTAIPYDEEDPYIRAEYEGTLLQDGAKSRMEAELYEASPEGERARAAFIGGT
jgi:quercetin dioxygenase-like cupin family protein